MITYTMYTKPFVKKKKNIDLIYHINSFAILPLTYIILGSYQKSSSIRTQKMLLIFIPQIL